jgi:Cys-tRNA(Pro)/Cys-tRNA(Cys) deacylase
MKTNAVRELDRLGIQYELREYMVDPEDLTAGTVAAKIGMPASQVFKTLVTEGDRTGVLLAVVPGDAELDLKALARLSENRRTALVPVKDVQALTGYIRGGVTALALKKPLPVYADSSIQAFDRISVSAGTRGLQIVLMPADYLKAVGATVGDIAARR